MQTIYDYATNTITVKRRRSDKYAPKVAWLSRNCPTVETISVFKGAGITTVLLPNLKK